MPMESHNTNIRESLKTTQPPPQRRALKTKKFVTQEKNKKCVTFLRGGGGGQSPEERPYDVSRGKNRFVTLPKTFTKLYVNKTYFM